MKKRIFKSALFFLSLSVLMCLMIFSASAKTVTSGDFKFDVQANSATLTEYKGTASAVTIPSKVSGVYVTAIGNEAFWSVKTMKSVTIPSTVTSIGIAAFNECTSLTKVVIPYKVKTIGESAFWYCTNLKTVVIPQSVSSIGKNAFKGCNSLTAYVIAGSYGENYIKQQSYISLGYRYMSTLKLNKSASTLTPGAYDRITCTVTPSTVYYKKVTFASSNTKVAIVNAYGTVKAVGCGTAVITVKAADGSNLVKKCTVKVVPGKVTSISQSATSKTGYTLNWKAVTGATQYKIYKYNATAKKWDSFAITDKLSYKVSSLTPSSVQYYRVMAFTKIGKYNYCGAVSSTFKAATAAPERPADTKNLQAKPAHTFINLSWDEAKNATGYRVYSYNLETEKYTFLLSTKSLKAQIKDLAPNTKYAFAVRTYAVSDGKTVYSNAVSDIICCTTRPDYVKNLTVASDRTSHNSITLKWDVLEGVAGYYISVYNEQTGAYDKIGEVIGDEIAEFTAEDLASSTSYKFAVRAFSGVDSNRLYGYNCTAVEAVTAEKPLSTEEAFNKFIEAYNASKASTGDLLLFRDKSFDENSINAPGKENYASVLDAIFNEKNDTYYFTNGVEDTLDKPLTSFVTPYNTLTALTYDMIDPESVAFEDDGSGYKIVFTLKSEDKNAANNALIAPVIDWDNLDTGVENFTLGSCTYTGTVIEAKVHNGKLDDVSISTPLDISFCIDETPYSFTGTVKTEYVFIWQ